MSPRIHGFDRPPRLGASGAWARTSLRGSVPFSTGAPRVPPPGSRGRLRRSARAMLIISSSWSRGARTVARRESAPDTRPGHDTESDVRPTGPASRQFRRGGAARGRPYVAHPNPNEVAMMPPDPQSFVELTEFLASPGYRSLPPDQRAATRARLEAASASWPVVTPGQAPLPAPLPADEASWTPAQVEAFLGSPAYRALPAEARRAKLGALRRLHDAAGVSRDLASADLRKFGGVR